MAVAYKGFNVYYCNPTTFENLQFVRRVELCIISKTGNVSAYNAKPSATILANWQSKGIDYTKLSGLAMVDLTYPESVSEQALYALRGLVPMCVNNLVNNTGQTCKLKLEGSNGYFAISQNQIGNGKNILGSSDSVCMYECYDNYGIQIGARLYLTAFGRLGVSFMAITNFDGVVLNRASCQYIALTVDYYNSDEFYVTATSETLTAIQASWLNQITPLPPEPQPDLDPYGNGGNSSTGGGGGDFDGTSDSIDFPSLPTLGATDTGFISLFNPTLAELNSLASYMWSSSFDVSLYKKLVTDPLDCILGLSIVPVAVPDGGRSAITVGNMVTPIFLTKAGAQYVEVDCGSINVNEFWGAYLDYEPFTKSEIYLPYCGIHPLSVDDVMGKTVAVKYHVDILSGACCAYVKCGGNVLYSFIGQCASSIPITGGDWTNMVNGVLSAAVSIGTMVATGGMSAPLAVAGVASTAVNGFKPSIEKSGAMSGTGGMLAIQKPYLILTRPNQALPENQNGYIGYPSFVTSALGDLSGYTEVESIHLQGVPATGEEASEIEQLLKMGVIL